MAKKDQKFKIATILLSVLVLVSAASAIYFYTHLRGQDDLNQEDLAALVGRIILLPQGEAPTIATINDLEPLKDQPFFTNAAIGDRVLIYNSAKKAFIFRPSLNKIIEVSTINFE